MSEKETFKRYTLFIISLFFTGLGVAFTKHAGLGVSPISSVANVLSIRFTFFSIGNWLVVTNCILILGQILLLRKRFNPIQLLQIPLSFVFGYFTDFGMWCVRNISCDEYYIRILLVLVGIVILGLGVSLGVIANVILNSGEGFVKAVADVAGKDFSTVKVIFDVLWVALSVVLSLIFFSGRLEGTREGTVISAVCTGFVVRFWRKLLQNPFDKILRK